MGEKSFSTFDETIKDSGEELINNRLYPPFGEQLDYNKLSRHAINMCPTLIIDHLNGAVVIKRNTANVFERTIQPTENKVHNEEETKPTNRTKTAHVKRKKSKKSRIIAEYQASQIPDNKGSTLSIDDLVKFVNGNDKSREHITTIGYKFNNNHIKSDRKQKSLLTNKVNSKLQHCLDLEKNDKSFDLTKTEYFDSIDDKLNSHNSIEAQTEESQSCEVAIFCDRTINNEDKISKDVEQDYMSETDNDSFFQVVRRKSRYKKVIEKSKYENFLNNSGNNSDINKTIVVNDKESLNIFISKLWMEFQSCYQEYVNGGSKRIHETEGY